MSLEIGAICAFGILAFLLLLIGFRRGFFALPQKKEEPQLRFTHLIGAFAIYFIITYLLSSFAIALLKHQLRAHFLGLSSWFNFAISSTVFCALALYWRSLPLFLRKGILCRGEFSLKKDLWAAFCTWLLAFPLVLFLSQLLEQITLKIFRVTQIPDQIAVKFLKSTLNNPLYFLLAILSIIFLAPLIEETLFRGFLQSYIRQRLGRNQAILITSVCFSLFHYASGQGISNISIIIPLFVFSLFLGFLYEKQESLFASISLHAIFNAVSVINLALFEDP